MQPVLLTRCPHGWHMLCNAFWVRSAHQVLIHNVHISSPSAGADSDMCMLQKAAKTSLGKAKKGDITGPDDSAVKAKAEVVEEVKKEVPTEEPDEDEKAGAKRRSRRET